MKGVRLWFSIGMGLGILLGMGAIAPGAAQTGAKPAPRQEAQTIVEGGRTSIPTGVPQWNNNWQWEPGRRPQTMDLDLDEDPLAPAAPRSQARRAYPNNEVDRSVPGAARRVEIVFP
jgi:hypothetical protein